MHFVQAKGLEYAHPSFINALNDAHDNARAIGMYNRNTTGEYWICGFEAYYDMWRHDPTGDGTREGEYTPISNFTLKAKDPAMYELVENFMGTHWLYTAEVVEEFEGTFSMTHDEDLTYTNKSQFLRKAMLTGGNDSNLTGNAEDNNLFGNSGDNVITPLGGVGRGGWWTGYRRCRVSRRSQRLYCACARRQNCGRGNRFHPRRLQYSAEC